MTAERIDLAAFRRVKRSVERDMRKDFAAELLVMPPGAAEAYLAHESARYALAFLRVAHPPGKAGHDR